jgi:membrane protein DedA with SNARE-associated domain
VDAQVVEWVAAFSYPAVVLLLVLCGLGVPLSEELIVITGGLVVARSNASLPGMMLAAYAGMLAGDTMLYRIGRTLGPRALAQPHLQRLFTPARQLHLRGLYARHGAWALFFGRFLPGVRAFGLVLAGASGVPLRRFLLADAPAALVSAPLLTWLGYRYGGSVLTHVQGSLRWALLGALALALAALALRALRRRRGSPAPSGRGPG